MKWTTGAVLLLGVFAHGILADSEDPVIPPPPKTTCRELEPLAIPLVEAKILNGTVRRGIPITVGTPPQTLLLDLIPDFNFTHLISSSPSCAPGSPCFSRSGGTFDSANSTSFDLTSEKDDIGTDTFSLSTPSLPLGADFSFVLASHEQEASSGLGLGRASTFLTALLHPERKVVDSNVWSLDWGYSGENIRNGELVVGGLNEGRVDLQGPKLEREFGGKGCMLAVEVGETSIGEENVADVEFEACVSPSFPGLAVPRRVFDGFNRTIWGVVSLEVEEGYLVVPVDEVMGDGNRTFTLQLSEEFSIDIPFHQLLAPRSSDSPGYLLKMVAINDGITSLLGQPFLSAAHLTVFPSTSTFTLRPSLPNPLPSLLHRLGPSPCTPPPLSKPDISLDRPLAAESEKNKARIIAGSIGGFFAFLALTTGLVIFFVTMRKRRRTRELLMGKANAGRNVGIGGVRFEDVEVRLPWDQESGGSKVGMAK